MLKFVVVLAVLGVALGLPANSSVKDVGPRIIGGGETDIEHIPWQLALLYYGRHYCGAVNIHPYWALTAAHCLEGAAVDNLSIRAGSTTKSFGGQLIDILTTYVHPEFNIRTVDYDFALLQLAEPITILTAAPVALPKLNEDVTEDETAIISGWGVISVEGVTPEIVRVVEVPVVGNEICQLAYPNNIVTERMFCAGDLLNGGLDACNGDGGGPVIVAGRLAGIVSWGSGCGNRNSPGVHAKVSSAIDWIYDTTGF